MGRDTTMSRYHLVMIVQRGACSRRGRRGAATGRASRVVVGLSFLVSAALTACGAPSTRPIEPIGTGHTHDHCHEADAGETCHTHGHEEDGHDGGVR